MSDQLVLVNVIFGTLVLLTAIATYILFLRTTSSLDRLVKALELKWTRESEDSAARAQADSLNARFKK